MRANLNSKQLLAMGCAGRTAKSMITLLFANHKGGVGKTTSAVMLAREFARRGLRPLVVDSADGHATLLLHAELILPLLRREEGRRRTRGPNEGRPLRMPLPVFGARHSDGAAAVDVLCTNERYASYLREVGVAEVALDWPELERRYAVVLVDTPSHCDPFCPAHPLYQELTHGARVLIPTQADPLAVGGLRLTLEYLREAAAARRPPRLCGAFITMGRPYESVNGVVEELRAVAPAGRLFESRIPYDERIARILDSGGPPSAGGNEATAIDDAYSSLAAEIIRSSGLARQLPN